MCASATPCKAGRTSNSSCERVLPVFLIFDILTEFLWSQQSEGSRSLPSRSQEVGSGHLSDSSPAVLVEPPRQKWSGMFSVAAAASDPSGCLPKELSVLSWEPVQLWALPTWALPAWALPWTGSVGLSVCLSVPRHTEDGSLQPTLQRTNLDSDFSVFGLFIISYLQSFGSAQPGSDQPGSPRCSDRPRGGRVSFIVKTTCIIFTFCSQYLSPLLASAPSPQTNPQVPASHRDG